MPLIIGDFHDLLGTLHDANVREGDAGECFEGGAGGAATEGAVAEEGEVEGVGRVVSCGSALADTAQDAGRGA